MKKKTSLKDTFASNLRATRVRLGITQDELAEVASVSLRYLQRLEQLPAKNVSLQTVDKMAAALGVESNVLVSISSQAAGLSADELAALDTAVRVLNSIISKPALGR